KRRAHSSGRRMHQRNAKLPFLVEFPALLLIEQTLGNLANLLFGKGVLIGDDDLPVDPESGRHTRHQMEIRSVELARGAHQPIELFGCAHREETRRPHPRSRLKIPFRDSPAKAWLASRHCGLSCCACWKESSAGPTKPSAAWHRPISSQSRKCPAFHSIACCNSFSAWANCR